jgi:hypothetical protein
MHSHITTQITMEKPGLSSTPRLLSSMEAQLWVFCSFLIPWDLVRIKGGIWGLLGLPPALVVLLMVGRLDCGCNQLLVLLVDVSEVEDELGGKKHTPLIYKQNNQTDRSELLMT